MNKRIYARNQLLLLLLTTSGYRVELTKFIFKVLQTQLKYKHSPINEFTAFYKLITEIIYVHGARK